MSQSELFFKFLKPAVLMGVLLVGASAGFAQRSTVPDAQVEANVLKALAGAPQLANQSIKTTTVYGTVTLSGVVPDEQTRVLAETLASKADGVQKVIDELTLGTTDPSAAPQSAAGQGSDASSGTNPNLQSDGTMGNAQHAPSPDVYAQTHPEAGQAVASQDDQAPQPSPAPANQPNQPPPPPAGRQPFPPRGYAPGPQPYGAQQAGIPVVVPTGAMLRIRINQGLDGKHSQVGTGFDAIVLNDVVADGEVAIPRGATVHGTVVEAKAAGALKGRGELALQLNQVTLGGKVFPLVSDTWSSNGPDKTAHTVNNTLGLGALGAIIGGVAGGGAGAAIGAGVGAGAGLGASAASGGGQAFVPPEAILTFHLTQQAPITTVSQAEMDRLGYGVPAGAQRIVRRNPYGPYYGPAYYRPYPYPY